MNFFRALVRAATRKMSRSSQDEWMAHARDPLLELLAQFAAGRYELVHEICNTFTDAEGDERADLVLLCPGPFFTTQFNP